MPVLAMAMPIPTQGVSPGGDQQQSLPALQQGQRALQAGQNEAAQKAFNEALRADPKSIDALIGLAELGARARNDGEVLRRLQQAEQLAPKRADVQTLLGRHYLTRRDLPKAEAALRKAVQLDPKGLVPRATLAEVLALQGKMSEALPLLQQAQQQEPNNAAVAFALGHVQQRLGASAEAERQWRRTAELDPKNPAPWLALAQTAKQASAALPLLDEALRRAPERADILLVRAQWQLQAKDAAGARDSLQRAAKSDPKRAAPWVQLGLLEEAAGRRAEARRHYLAALERDAFEPVALNNLVMIGLAENEDPVRLELMARRAVKALPDQPAVHDTLARTLRARKDKKGALTAASEAVRLAPKDASMRLLLAEIQQWSGDRTAARQSAEQVLTLQASGDIADKARALLTRL